MMNFLFGGAKPAPAEPEKTPAEKMKENVKQWQKNLRKEILAVDRSTRGAFLAQVAAEACASACIAISTPSILLQLLPLPHLSLYLASLSFPFECACAELKASEVKLAAEVKSLIAKNQVENAKRIVVQVCRVRKGIERQAATHAMLNSLVLQLGEQQGALAALCLPVSSRPLTHPH